MRRSPRILFFAPTPEGGIAEYAWRQASALRDLGAEVLFLASPGFLPGRKMPFQFIPVLLDPPRGGNGLGRKLRLAWTIIFNRLVLAVRVLLHRPDLVLLDSFCEYLSPIWIDPHILLSRIIGFPYAANLHDPVRSHRIGPGWWHRLSVWLAYEPLRFVLVHRLPGDPAAIPPRVRVIEVPHGPYGFPAARKNREETRGTWGIPSGATVFLSFGFVRDGKNIDQVIEALAEVPEAFLVVMGKVASTADRSFDWYRDHAHRCGVLERCRFFEGFVKEEEIGGAFEASDYVLLTYGTDFHSQSGVLQMAAHARKPVLASAASCPMLDTVRKHGLGVVIPAATAVGIGEGMRVLIRGIPSPRWEEYAAQASWQANASLILQAAGLRSS
jgi:glycosyltransferase involved in cell wall biosynthesis